MGMVSKGLVKEGIGTPPAWWVLENEPGGGFFQTGNPDIYADKLWSLYQLALLHNKQPRLE